jgi:hypothetical protein
MIMIQKTIKLAGMIALAVLFRPAGAVDDTSTIRQFGHRIRLIADVVASVVANASVQCDTETFIVEIDRRQERLLRDLCGIPQKECGSDILFDGRYPLMTQSPRDVYLSKLILDSLQPEKNSALLSFVFLSAQGYMLPQQRRVRLPPGAGEKTAVGFVIVETGGPHGIDPSAQKSQNLTKPRRPSDRITETSDDSEDGAHLHNRYESASPPEMGLNPFGVSAGSAFPVWDPSKAADDYNRNSESAVFIPSAGPQPSAQSLFGSNGSPPQSESFNSARPGDGYTFGSGDPDYVDDAVTFPMGWNPP